MLPVPAEQQPKSHSGAAGAAGLVRQRYGTRRLGNLSLRFRCESYLQAPDFISRIARVHPMRRLGNHLLGLHGLLRGRRAVPELLAGAVCYAELATNACFPDFGLHAERLARL